MNPQDLRPWYKKKRFLIPLGILAVLAISGAGSGDSRQPATQNSIPAVQGSNSISPTAHGIDQLPSAQKNASSITPVTNSVLSNDNYYTNTTGNDVHSPAYSNTIPAGATAQCRDGTYSFSQSRRGTCSHHGGVATWL